MHYFFFVTWLFRSLLATVVARVALYVDFDWDQCAIC